MKWLAACFVLIAVVTESLHGDALSQEVGTSRLRDVDPGLGKPRKVTAELEGTNTIRLRWEAPLEKSDPDCPIDKYHIRLREEGGKRSRTWKVDANRESISLHNLSDNTVYYLRLMAVTCSGKGGRTRWIEVRTQGPRVVEQQQLVAEGAELRTPPAPQNVQTQVLDDSVLVTWEPPQGGVLVRGYKVGYSQGVPDLNWKYVSARDRNATLQNLKRGTEYVISLCAWNNVGEGMPVYREVAIYDGNTESSLGPFSTPVEVRAKVLTATTVWLQWKDPSLGSSQQLTDSRHYNVHYQALPNGKTMSMIVKGLSMVLYDLQPGTTYAFNVRTVKDALSSRFSETTRNTTFEAVPSTPPRSVTVLPTNDSSTVHLEWRPPREPNGNVTDYLVLYTTEANQNVAEWETFAVSGLTTQVMISALKPNTTYYFRVQARNSKGFGPASNTLVYHTSPSKTHKEGSVTVPDREFNEVDFESTDPSHHPQIRFEFPDYGHEGDGDYDGEYDDLYPPVVGDQPRQDDRGQNVAGAHSRFETYLDPNKARDSAPLRASFQSIVKHTVSAVVRWELPCSDQPPFPSGGGVHRYPPVSYLIRYFPQNNPSEYTDKISPTNFVLLDNLRPNQKYTYLVKRTVGDEESGWSQEGYLDTSCPSGHQ